jgi:hypothetical protein
MTRRNIGPSLISRCLLAMQKTASDILRLPGVVCSRVIRRKADIYPVSGRRLNPPGPSPWYLRRMKITIGDDTFAWSEYVGPTLAGISRLYTRRSKTLLLLNFNCYAQPLVGGRLLIWCARDRGNYDDGLDPIVQFDILDLSHLEPIVDPAAKASCMRQAKRHWFIPGEPLAEFTFPTSCQLGTTRLEGIPLAFKEIDETLVLASYPPDTPLRANLAIYVFDFRHGQVEVIPQDWFNNGDYDFGYQWVTRIARDPTTGQILGEGIRLRAFRLTRSGRQVEQWLDRSQFRPAT